MISVTLDTNVLASGALRSQGSVRQVIEAWLRGEILVVLSPYILRELEDALMKPYFTQRMSQAAIDAYCALVSEQAEVVQFVDRISRVASHPEDDRVIETALSGEVDYLVTGDKGLLTLGRYRSVTILSPQAFLQVLVAQRS